MCLINPSAVITKITAYASYKVAPLNGSQFNILPQITNSIKSPLIAASEPTETYFEKYVTSPKVESPNTVKSQQCCGNKHNDKITPEVAAIPLPPLKFR